MEVEVASERERNSDGPLMYKIVVRVFMKRDFDTSHPRNKYSAYHVLDLKSGLVSTLDHTLLDLGLVGTMVAIGSKIYMLGQTNRPDSETYGENLHQGTSYFDLRTPQIGWNKAAPVSTKESSPISVSLGGRIYLFRDWACSEVFDPVKNEWRWIRCPPLPPEGKELRLTPPVLADPINNRIIVYSNSMTTLYAYHPSKNRWEALVEGFIGWRRPGPVALAEGVIFIHFTSVEGFFKAFDIESKKWLKVVLTCSKSDFQSCLHLKHYGCLHYLGNGVLCLLASRAVSADDTSYVEVFQIKVEFKVEGDHKEVFVTPLSSDKYALGGFAMSYEQFIPILP